jgi:hypothetical protein
MKHRWSLIAGGRDGLPRIAFSLVHPRGRIDVALTDVLAIEALPDVTFSSPDGPVTFNAAPHVEVALTPHIGARLLRLTRDIVGDTIDIVVGGGIVSSPIVQEPLGWQGAFHIKVSDMKEAEALAAKLLKGWAGPDLRMV